MPSPYVPSTRPPGVKRSKQQRLDDRAKIADLRLRGYHYGDIARAVGCSSKLVQSEMRVLEKQWREEASEDIAAIKARELHKLDKLEAEAWQAWERSKRSTRKVVADKEGLRRERTSNTGDPRYMSIIHNIGQQRARLMGLDAPVKFAPTTPGGEALDLRTPEDRWDMSALSYTEMVQLRALQQKMKRAPAEPAAPDGPGE